MAEENLFPEDMETTLDEDELIEEGETVIGYKKGVCFDDITGDLLLDGNGSIVECTPIDAWVQWGTKCIETPRFQCRAYSSDIGIDADEVRNAITREEQESMLYSEISEALSADPYGRTAYVQSIEFDWIASDTVNVSVTVVGIEDVAPEVNATIQV